MCLNTPIVFDSSMFGRWREIKRAAKQYIYPSCTYGNRRTGKMGMSHNSDRRTHSSLAALGRQARRFQVRGDA